MAPQQHSLLSPSELAYLHSSLSLSPPVRPDGRSPITFRPLSAETDLLPSTNGSARLCFADGTEAIVGIKVEVQKSKTPGGAQYGDVVMTEDAETQQAKVFGEDSWIEVTIDIPGQRDDDNMIVFLGQMIHEGLVAEDTLKSRLFINRTWHWKLFIDVCAISILSMRLSMAFAALQCMTDIRFNKKIVLFSPPDTYPLPLLSFTTHLALFNTRLPALVSTGDEDPLFNDDWDAALQLYPATGKVSNTSSTKPPIALLVTAVGENIFFDASREELAVADAVLAVTIAPFSSSTSEAIPALQALAVRTIDPPARLAASTSETDGAEEGVWRPRRGGMPRTLVKKMVQKCVEKGGVGDEVFGGLQAFL